MPTAADIAECLEPLRWSPPVTTCGYCSVLDRPCACKRPAPPKPRPHCERLGTHVWLTESPFCLYCGTEVR